LIHIDPALMPRASLSALPNQEIGQVALNAANDRIVRLEQPIAEGAKSAPSEDARLSDTERGPERDGVGRLPYSSGSVVNNSG
jgi:hypothetical protein